MSIADRRSIAQTTVETPVPEAGAAGIATATAGFATGGLKTSCAWTLGSGVARLEGFAACGFAFGFCVDAFGAFDAAGFAEEG